MKNCYQVIKDMAMIKWRFLLAIMVCVLVAGGTVYYR